MVAASAHRRRDGRRAPGARTVRWRRGLSAALHLRMRYRGQWRHEREHPALDQRRDCTVSCQGSAGRDRGRSTRTWRGAQQDVPGAQPLPASSQGTLSQPGGRIREHPVMDSPTTPVPIPSPTPSRPCAARRPPHHRRRPASRSSPQRRKNGRAPSPRRRNRRRPAARPSSRKVSRATLLAGIALAAFVGVGAVGLAASLQDGWATPPRSERPRAPIPRRAVTARDGAAPVQPTARVAAAGTAAWATAAWATAWRGGGMAAVATAAAPAMAAADSRAAGRRPAPGTASAADRSCRRSTRRPAAHRRSLRATLKKPPSRDGGFVLPRDRDA